MPLRTATVEDIESIRVIAHEVWPIAYSQIISQEQIQYMLQKMYSPESLNHQMLEEGCEFLILSADGRDVGFSSTSALNKTNFKLHKLYVLSSMQGRGCGVELLNEVCSRAIQKGGERIELQVNKNNPAYHFYLKQGFVKERELVLDIGNGFVMDDFILVKSLA